MTVRRISPSEDRATTGEIVMMLLALAPVVGAVLAGPGMGFTLVTLGLLDSALILTGLQ